MNEAQDALSSRALSEPSGALINTRQVMSRRFERKAVATGVDPTVTTAWLGAGGSVSTLTGALLRCSVLAGRSCIGVQTCTGY